MERDQDRLIPDADTTLRCLAIAGPLASARPPADARSLAGRSPAAVPALAHAQPPAHAQQPAAGLAPDAADRATVLRQAKTLAPPPLATATMLHPTPCRFLAAAPRATSGPPAAAPPRPIAPRPAPPSWPAPRRARAMHRRATLGRAGASPAWPRRRKRPGELGSSSRAWSALSFLLPPHQVRARTGAFDRHRCDYRCDRGADLLRFVTSADGCRARVRRPRHGQSPAQASRGQSPAVGAGPAPAHSAHPVNRLHQRCTFPKWVTSGAADEPGQDFCADNGQQKLTIIRVSAQPNLMFSLSWRIDNPMWEQSTTIMNGRGSSRPPAGQRRST
jgi:hypothetical protein